MASIPRLYIDQPLWQGQTVTLGRDQSHYLVGVMRRGVGDPVALFNGRDGAWRAAIEVADKRGVRLVAESLDAPQRDPPDLWLCFAPIKKARTDFIVEKAAELGAARICPVQTDHTNAERVRRERLQAHAAEAAEQCGGTFVPDVAELVTLDALLSDWPRDRHLMFCDEATAGPATVLPARGEAVGSWAVLIGPEGGFSPTERTRLRAMRQACPVSLGPRILRADTAAVAALALWQQALGDWA